MKTLTTRLTTILMSAVLAVTFGVPYVRVQATNSDHTVSLQVYYPSGIMQMIDVPEDAFQQPPAISYPKPTPPKFDFDVLN
jgi:hypothetical protein